VACGDCKADRLLPPTENDSLSTPDRSPCSFLERGFLRLKFPDIQTFNVRI